jgi:hypothetical protein
MDFKFDVAGMMNVDITKYKVFNETKDGIFEWEYEGKLYNLVLAVEVFDMDSKETSYIVGDDKLREAGFDIHDYSDIQWEIEYPSAEKLGEGLKIDDLI